MKELELGLTYSVAINVPVDLFQGLKPGEERKFHHLSKEETEEIQEGYKQARINSALLITATIQLEDKISHLIGNVLCGPVDIRLNPITKQRNFLGHNLLESKHLSYDARRAILSELIEEFELLSTTKRKALVSGIKKIGGYRNAFAHGKLGYHEKDGFSLSYHSNGFKNDKLDDHFWERIERLFSDTEEQLSQLQKHFYESEYFKQWLPNSE